MLRGLRCSKMAEKGMEENLVEVQVTQCGQTYKALIAEKLAAELTSPNCDPEKRKCVFDAIITPPVGSDDKKGMESLWDNKITKIINRSTTDTETTAKLPNATNEQIHIWTESEEKLLLNLRCSREEKFCSSKAHDTLWNEILKEIHNHNIHVTKIQLINKWKNLKKKFKEVVDNNSRTGNSKITWKYYDTFNEIYGNKASTHPAFCVDTSRTGHKIVPAKPTGTSNDNDGDLTSSPSGSQSLPKLARPSSSRKRTLQASLKDDVSKLLEEGNKDVLKTLKKQHKEKMKRMDRLLDVFESFVGTKTKKSHNEDVTDDDTDIEDD